MSESFFRRWSRQKELNAAPTLPSAEDASATKPQTGRPLPPASPAAPATTPDTAQTPTPSLEQAMALPTGADIRRFLMADVPQAVQHLALKKLFADPRYNVISEMDDYVEDFSNLAKLTQAEVRRLHQSQSLHLFDDPPCKPTTPPAPLTSATPPCPAPPTPWSAETVSADQSQPVSTPPSDHAEFSTPSFEPQTLASSASHAEPAKLRSTPELAPSKTRTKP